MSVSTVVRRGEYRIDRSRDERRAFGHTIFSVLEPGEERRTIEVEVYAPSQLGWLELSKVSWPGTSDKRPLVARALAEALVLAAAEADSIDERAVFANQEYQDEIPGGSLCLVVDVEAQEGGIEVWTIEDARGRRARVPAGSQDQATRVAR